MRFLIEFDLKDCILLVAAYCLTACYVRLLTELGPLDSDWGLQLVKCWPNAQQPATWGLQLDKWWPYACYMRFLTEFDLKDCIL